MIGNRIQLTDGNWDSALNLVHTIPVNVGNIDSTRMLADVTAELQADVTSYVALLNTEGFGATDQGAITPPVPPTPPTPPTADEITRDAEVKTAFNTMMVAEIARLDALALIEYDLIKTTAEAYLRKFDIKHLRQRAS